MANQIQFAAMLDALQWLTIQASKGLVTPLGKDAKKVFSLDRSFTVHSTALILDQKKALHLAMRKDTTTQWFVNLPWLKLQVFNQRRPAFVNLICQQIEFPAVPEIKFEGGVLPAFSLKIPMYSKLAKSLTTQTAINLGLFEAGSTDDEIVLSDAPVIEQLPLEFCK